MASTNKGSSTRVKKSGSSAKAQKSATKKSTQRPVAKAKTGRAPEGQRVREQSGSRAKASKNKAVSKKDSSTAATKKASRVVKPGAKKTSARKSVEKVSRKGSSAVKKVSSTKSTGRASDVSKAKVAETNATLQSRDRVDFHEDRQVSGASTSTRRSSAKSTSSASRRAKDKDKGNNKSPFSHTDHASIFRAVEARKAAAKAKLAKLEPTQSKPKRVSSRRLTDKQLASFEEMLLRIRAELLRQIAYLRGASLTRSDEVNPEEDGTDAFERQLALKLAAGEGDSIFEIDEALERIRQKMYGICEECSCVIPRPRLKALPFARRCVECQSKVEQKPNMTDHRHY